MGINKDSETSFYINEVYRIDKDCYARIRQGSRRLRVFLPDLNFEGNDSPGELFLKSIQPNENGLSKEQSKDLSHYARRNFRNAYLKILDLPEHDDTAPRDDENGEQFAGIDDAKILFLPSEYRSRLVEKAQMMFGSETRIIWIDCKALANADEFKSYFCTRFSTITGIPLDPGNQFGSLPENYPKIRPVIILENCPTMNAAVYFEPVIELLRPPLASALPNMQTYFLSEYGKDEILAAISAPQPQKSIKINRNIVAIGVAFCIPLIILLFVTLGQKKNMPVKAIQVLYFSDESAKDALLASGNVFWIDKNEKVIHQESLGYKPYFIPNGIPEAAVKMTIIEGASEIYPESVNLKDIANDTLRFDYYRNIVPEEAIFESINRAAAQRWFAIKLQKPVKIYFFCHATDGKFSPQIALYNNRFGKTSGRISESSNQTGRVLADSTGGQLPAGKYYLKVRGYDKSTGAFRISSAIR